MSNKLPWFTHDHDARHDDFIHRAEDKFGPFGYSAYFKLLEVLHEHGVGDILKMTSSRLCSELRCTWPKLQVYLDYTQTMGKVAYKYSSGEVELQIKKFRERQSKLKSNLPSTFRQPSINLQEKEKEIEIKKDTFTKETKPFSFSICTYNDKGQGICDQPREGKSKYCSHHKIKVREQFLDKEAGSIRGGGFFSTKDLLK